MERVFAEVVGGRGLKAVFVTGNGFAEQVLVLVACLLEQAVAEVEKGLGPPRRRGVGVAQAHPVVILGLAKIVQMIISRRLVEGDQTGIGAPLLGLLIQLQGAFVFFTFNSLVARAN